MYGMTLVKYGVRSPKVIWAPLYSCTHWLRPRNSPLPPHLGSYTKALLVSQGRRHLFVTPWRVGCEENRGRWNERHMHDRSVGGDRSMHVLQKTHVLSHTSWAGYIYSTVQYMWQLIILLHKERLRYYFRDLSSSMYYIYNTELTRVGKYL
jgi:hypothetical protein